MHLFQQTFKGSVGRSMADRQEKKMFPTNPRVRKMMEHSFSPKIYRICIGKNDRLSYGRYS